MPVVFVHGVPETPAVWRPLIDALGRDDAVALQLPGFGSPLPPGFSPTKESYAAWLRAELDGIDGVIDLVGHDWGALLTLRVLADGIDGVRSWVTDGGDLDPSYEWHDLAKGWQTPEVGEAMMATLLTASADDRAAIAVDAGIPAEAHALIGDALDQTMADAILALYRSATDVGDEWGDALDRVEVPTLVINAALDPFHSPASSQAAASRLGARSAELAAGHWWMVEAPQRAATALEDFWASLSP